MYESRTERYRHLCTCVCLCMKLTLFEWIAEVVRTVPAWCYCPRRSGSMIFTVLSGDACSSRPKPLAYVLQIDDIKVLLDCGSPEWCPESSEDPDTDWTDYCSALERSCLAKSY